MQRMAFFVENLFLHCTVFGGVAVPYAAASHLGNSGSFRLRVVQDVVGKVGVLIFKLSAFLLATKLVCDLVDANSGQHHLYHVDSSMHALEVLLQLG